MRTTSSALVALAAVATLSLAACGGGSSGSGDDKEFTYWSMWRPEEPQAKVIKAAVAKFTSSTGVKVKLQFHGRDVRTQIGPAIAAGQAPDLWDQGADVLYAVGAQTGQSADLSSVYAADVPGEGKKVSDVIPAKYLQALPKDPNGSTKWIVPYEVVGAALFYDGSDASLATPPATWADLLKYCDTLKGKGKACLTAEGDDGWASGLWVDYLVTRDNGAGTMGRLWQDKSGQAWKQPNIVASVAKLERLVKGGYFLGGYGATKAPAQENNWARGKASLFLNGSWVPSETASLHSAGFKPKAINFPTTVAGRTETDQLLFGWSVPKKAKKQAAAKKFIAYFLQKDVLSGIATTADNIAVRDDIPAPPALADVKKILLANPTRPVLDNAPGEYSDKVFNPAVTNLITGKASAQQFVDAVASAQSAYWKAQG
jgi:ABC-type glycerol-3-phosphate transport system substrate-binding protein